MKDNDEQCLVLLLTTYLNILYQYCYYSIYLYTKKIKFLRLFFLCIDIASNRKYIRYVIYCSQMQEELFVPFSAWLNLYIHMTLLSTAITAVFSNMNYNVFTQFNSFWDLTALLNDKIQQSNVLLSVIRDNWIISYIQ